MSIDAHVASSPCKAFVFTVRDVFSSHRVNILLGKAKVNDMDDAVFFVRVSADEEILRLNISIYEIL